MLQTLWVNVGFRSWTGSPDEMHWCFGSESRTLGGWGSVNKKYYCSFAVISCSSLGKSLWPQSEMGYWA